MIVRAICSGKKTECICGQDYPREVIKSAMLKVDRVSLENAIEQIKQTDNVRNYERYLISTSSPQRSTIWAYLPTIFKS